MSKPLRIALIMQGGRGWMGGAEYIKNLILAVASLPFDSRPPIELCLICRDALDDHLHNQIAPHLHQIYDVKTDLAPLTLPNRLRWKALRTFLKQSEPQYSEFLRKEKFDFVYPFYEQTSRKPSYRSAAWIYDFQHRYLPHFFSEQEIQGRDRTFASIARHSSTVVLSSKTAEADFHKFFPEATAKTEVLSFKTTPSLQWYEGQPQDVQATYSLPDRFFLVSNQFWQHKNHLVIFKALSLLQQQGIYPNVVCTGHIYDYRCPDYSDTILQTIHQLGIANQVYLLGLIPKSDQVQLMRRAMAIIQPSLFEGWSTLVEDARCLGKPMILSDLPVNLEQSPPHSVFFQRESPELLATLLSDWWEHLSPGPDLKQEENARINSQSEVQAFGYRFLEIVQKC